MPTAPLGAAHRPRPPERAVQSPLMRRGLPIALAAALAAAAAGGALPPEPDPLAPPAAGGLAAVDRALARLAVHARLLVVGAHPDDEDTELLSWVSRGLGGEAAYLSLSRGEGGQNLIGPELGVELGVIRTGELLAARRLEGGRQYFTRAYDFGYTRSLEETFARWPRHELQEDAVRVVRRFQPQVLVAVFAAGRRAGHGQHQASAVIATDAYQLAGDGERFGALPEAPWTPSALYRRAWRGEDATLTYSLAALEPITGRSLAQIAAASRSCHRSQDMGVLQPLGPAEGGLVWLAGGAGADGREPFAGIDTRLAAIAATVGDDALRGELERLLGEVEREARGARARLSPSSTADAVQPLASIVERLRRGIGLLAGAGDPAPAARRLLAEKLAIAERGLAAAAGVVVDAVADRETVTPGGELELTTELWAAGDGRVAVTAVTALGRDGWQPAESVEAEDGGGLVRRRFRVTLAADAPPTTPYFLRRPLRGELYDWSEAPAEERGEPLGTPPLVARFELAIGGAAVTLEREAVYRWADQAFGERRRPLRAVPAIEVEVQPGLVVRPVAAAAGELAVTVRTNASRPLAVRLDWRQPADWPRLAARQLELAPGGSQTVRLALPATVGAGRFSLTAVVEQPPAPGRSAGLALRVVEAPHVRPVAVPVAATAEVSQFPLRLPRLTAIGYVVGTSDRLPAVLAALGLPVELVPAAELERAELARYDAIVIGSRAYESQPALARANGRLLDYARLGGLVVVEYQQYAFARGGYAPYPLDITRPHGRVTDEGAPVELLAPDHPVFLRPNRITAADWQGWVQERGLYFAGSWDERYRPLVALADPGLPPERGALLVAAVGEGAWIYTGLSFFRQLPAGVAGAVRLFVNLLALAEKEGEVT